MTDRELMRQALEALEEIADEVFSPYDNELGKVILALRERLAQPEQEPVAWMNPDTPSGVFARYKQGAENFGCTVPLYTTPPRREWQGLAADSTIQTVPAQGGLLPAQFGIRGGLAQDTQNKEQNR